MNPTELDGPAFDVWLAVATRCSRCPAVSKTRVTTELRGKERVCLACAAAIAADEEARKREVVTAPPRPTKPFSNIDNVNRMCAAFGLQSPFAPKEPEMPTSAAVDRELRLSSIVGFPAGAILSDWTLGKLLDRAQMVAQFDADARTLDKAMLQALEGVVGPTPAFEDDAGCELWLAERGRAAAACRDAVMNHLKRENDAMPTKPKPKKVARTSSPPAPPAEVRAPAPPPADVPLPDQKVTGQAKLSEIRPSPLNPRKTFPADAIDQLAASISEQGLLQSLLVRPVGADGAVPLLQDGGWVGLSHFELVDGERRYRALSRLRDLGKLDEEKVPVVVRWLTDAQTLAIMIVANDQREDVVPSEQAAGYAALAASLGSAEAVAAAVGKPVSHVRGGLRMARLPAWALAAVDAGTLPRATAELVSRVPGEESRKRAAACVLLGLVDPEDLDGIFNDGDTWEEAAEAIGTGAHAASEPPLSYRDTRDLIRHHFTVELKGAPFSRKALDLVPGHESCEQCPDRAGNNEDAKADGVRADVCLNPDCYRAKVAAYRAKEIAKAWERGIGEADVEITDMRRQPRGWLFVESQLQHCAPELDVAGVPRAKAEKKLKDLLAAPVQAPKYIAFDTTGKPVFLAKTSEARKALQEAGVLKKPVPQKRAERPVASTGGEKAKPQKGGPSSLDIDERASAIAGKVLAEFAEMNFDDLDQIEDLTGDEPYTSAVWEAFRFLARFLIRDHIAFGHERGQIVERALGLEENSTLGRSGVVEAEKKLGALGHRATLALCFRLAAECELQAAPAGPFGTELLAWAELDWSHLQEQARRELSGGEPAEAKISRAESARAAENLTDTATADPIAATVAEAPQAPAPSGDLLSAIPDFPKDALAHLERVAGVRTVQDLDARLAELRKEKGRATATRYSLLRELQTPSALLAGDALEDWEAAKVEQKVPKAKPKKEPRK